MGGEWEGRGRFSPCILHQRHTRARRLIPSYSRLNMCITYNYSRSVIPRSKTADKRLRRVVLAVGVGSGCREPWPETVAVPLRHVARRLSDQIVSDEQTRVNPWARFAFRPRRGLASPPPDNENIVSWFPSYNLQPSMITLSAVKLSSAVFSILNVNNENVVSCFPNSYFKRSMKTLSAVTTKLSSAVFSVLTSNHQWKSRQLFPQSWP